MSTRKIIEFKYNDKERLQPTRQVVARHSPFIFLAKDTVCVQADITPPLPESGQTRQTDISSSLPLKSESYDTCAE